MHAAWPDSELLRRHVDAIAKLGHLPRLPSGAVHPSNRLAVVAQQRIQRGDIRVAHRGREFPRVDRLMGEAGPRGRHGTDGYRERRPAAKDQVVSHIGETSSAVNGDFDHIPWPELGERRDRVGCEPVRHCRSHKQQEQDGDIHGQLSTPSGRLRFVGGRESDPGRASTEHAECPADHSRDGLPRSGVPPISGRAGLDRIAVAPRRMKRRRLHSRAGLVTR